LIAIAHIVPPLSPIEHEYCKKVSLSRSFFPPSSSRLSSGDFLGI